MSKLNDLRELYDNLELNTADERELLSKVKNREATEDEINELLDIINGYPNGAKTLNDIKNFENNLVEDIENHIGALVSMEFESNEVAHIEDEAEKDGLYKDMKVRYNNHIEKSDETYEAIKEAYFQVEDFDQYYNRLYEAKQNLLHLE